MYYTIKCPICQVFFIKKSNKFKNILSKANVRILSKFKAFILDISRYSESLKTVYYGGLKARNGLKSRDTEFLDLYVGEEATSTGRQCSSVQNTITTAVNVK